MSLSTVWAWHERPRVRGETSWPMAAFTSQASGLQTAPHRGASPQMRSGPKPMQDLTQGPRSWNVYPGGRRPQPSHWGQLPMHMTSAVSSHPALRREPRVWRFLLCVHCLKVFTLSLNLCFLSEVW